MDTASVTIVPVADPPTPTNTAQASLLTGQLSVGSHVIRATYSGDANYASAVSQTPVSVIVSPATTSTTLTSLSTPQGTTLMATVQVTSPGNPPLAGTVSFFDGATLLNTISVTNGVASLSVGLLPPGPHNFLAVFTGDGTSSSSTATAAVTTDGPQIIGLSRYGFHALETVLVLNFDSGLDPARAQNAANYQIRDDAGRRLAIRGVYYDPTNFRVTLIPSHRLNVHRAYTLKVIAGGNTGVAAVDGTALDGTGTGAVGTDFTTKLTWRALTVPGGSPAIVFANGQEQEYTGKFGPYANAVVRTTKAALHAGVAVAPRHGKIPKAVVPREESIVTTDKGRDHKSAKR
jgi:hypothetical protein